MFVQSYSDDGRRLTLTGSGRVLGSELIHATKELLGQQDRIRKLREALVLLDQIEGLDASGEDLRQVAGLDQELSSWSKGVRIAVVATNPAAFGLGRMWEAFVAVLEWEVMVLRSREEAETWLSKRK